MNRMVPNSAANSSGPSVGASSLVTDANSALSGGPQLQRSASINTESYTRLPASPMSFSSNNISGSPMDGSSLVQQSSHQEPMPKQGASSVTSQLTGQEHLGNLLHAQKKPRIDMRQDDVHQHVIQQLLQRQDSMQLQGHPSPQLQAMIQQQRLAQRQQQQQQLLQFLPQMQRAQIQQHQQQMRNTFQQQAFLEKQPIESGICARRLMQYIYHQRHCPQEDSILYWRKVVVQYFAPRARKRWCLAMYDNVGNHAALGAFPRSSTEAWQCGICGSKSGKGFEATFEVLPRLNQIKFDRGVLDELLFVDMPHEYRLPSGAMVLEYAKAVQETVYEQLRVVREGQLRIIFSQELKILLWEFCARRHEEFLPRRLVAPQVNQLLQVAQKIQSTVSETGSAGVSPQELQKASCDMFVTAGRQLARSIELQSLNDLGFSKRYVRCLQIAEVVSSMKDLIEFSQEHKTGPIESLKNYARQASAKHQSQKMQEIEQLVNAQCLPADQSALNKILANHPGLTTHLNNCHSGNRILNNNAQAAVSLNSYQNLLRNSINPNQNTIQSDASCSMGGPTQAPPVQFPGPMTSILSNPSVNSLSGPQQQQHQQPQPQPPQLTGLPQQNNMPSSQANQNLQQHVIQQMLQDMMNNNRGMPQQSLGGPNAVGNIAADVIGAPGNLTPRMNNTGTSEKWVNAGECHSRHAESCLWSWPDQEQ
ncbi:LIM-domain binding protein/SEUSS protein [Dioscorea alata]|uniref:LIM-domain binding protein/SEUSS protein n=4 Tax=Dioscorea alata TaxID=55571 RepID=A0ACB7V4T2_DIOAL|nr:LIM-domain binding protein/SEUSS protein [Dioscorea alata]KAH7668451.1 LIM-domain binding protein/SEUSS protein [Dioscorea alata]KAH7668452.1 LIM-domain binding protein/SEUSS protein [Dioscorea alata]KAH7668453.1 LIM-domain binding protein/SEUSS protein [Dioscorea alata]